MKIVVNTCFGGFSLSLEAVMAYAQRKGLELTAWVSSDSDPETWIPYVPDETVQFISFFKGNEPKDENYFSPDDIPRNDPDLVAIVEVLGEAANGDCANLAVVEIPDDVKWYIDDYDGSECVAERHRTWRPKDPGDTEDTAADED